MELEIKSIIRKIGNTFWTLEHYVEKSQKTTYPQMTLSSTYNFLIQLLSCPTFKKHSLKNLTKEVEDKRILWHVWSTEIPF